MRRRPPVRLAAAAALLALVVTTACSEATEDPLPERGSTSEDGTASFVALGDSLTAGGGAPPYLPGSPCFRSERGWPFLLDRPDVDLRACGGATVPELLAGREGRDPQVPSEPDEDVELVAMTIGLNDINYPVFGLTCFQGDCSGGGRPSDVLEVALSAVRANLVERLYPALRAAYPEARIVHVGYPHLVPAEQADVVGCDWLADPERRLLRLAVDEFHAMVRAAVDDADDLDIEFLDVSDALVGHELCTAESTYVAIGDLSGAGGHPSAAGYELMAEAIRAEL